MTHLMVHPYNKNNEVYNFFFHPLHFKKDVSVLSVITNIFISVITLGLWQIAFWVVNRLDHKRVEAWEKKRGEALEKISKVKIAKTVKKSFDILFGCENVFHKISPCDFFVQGRLDPKEVKFPVMKSIDNKNCLLITIKVVRAEPEKHYDLYLTNQYPADNRGPRNEEILNKLRKEQFLISFKQNAPGSKGWIVQMPSSEGRPLFFKNGIRNTRLTNNKGNISSSLNQEHIQVFQDLIAKGEAKDPLGYGWKLVDHDIVKKTFFE